MKKRVTGATIASMLLLIIVIVSGSAANTEQTQQQGEITGMSKTLPPYESVTIAAKIPAESLPYQKGDLENLEEVKTTLALSPEAMARLTENGFTVIQNPFYQEEQDIIAPYQSLKGSGIPIFVTSDSLLHMYHIQFDKTLRDLEEQELYDQIWVLSRDLLTKSLADYEQNEGDVKEAARRNAAFLSVGLSLLAPDPEQVATEPTVEDPLSFVMDSEPDGSFTKQEGEQYTFTIPAVVADEVQAESSLITAHEGFSDSPIFTYPEDYSQYVPRGHYTQSEKLKNYFMAMMWYGRISYLLKGGSNALVSAEDARIQTYGASLLSYDLKDDPDLLNRWDRIYQVTSFFVGTSDDLGPYEYNAAIDTVIHGSFSPDRLNETSYSGLKTELAAYPSPRIFGGTGNCAVLPPFTPEDTEMCLDKTKGFRLMGQRFIPDSYVFTQLTGPNTGPFTGTGSPFTLVDTLRGFPLGLDVMSLLGSDRAADIISGSENAAYETYQNQFNNLSNEFNSLDNADWQKNLYWAWLYSLVPLLGVPGEGYPAFMQNEAWLDKSISTALASWTELRHDTILYAKQSYTPLGLAIGPIEEPQPPVVGFVEPNPELYNRLLYLTTMTQTGLDSLQVLDDPTRDRLTELEEILSRLVEISTKELAYEPLTPEDYIFIDEFGDNLESVIGDVDEKTKWTTMVADVHTDSNSEKVLEEGIGYVDLLVVAYPVPDGRILVGAGPVLSYYEFKQPMADRLTDEAWRTMLAETPVAKPWWTDTFTT